MKLFVPNLFFTSLALIFLLPTECHGESDEDNSNKRAKPRTRGEYNRKLHNLKETKKTAKSQTTDDTEAGAITTGSKKAKKSWKECKEKDIKKGHNISGKCWTPAPSVSSAPSGAPSQSNMPSSHPSVSMEPTTYLSCFTLTLKTD